jgi:hypothetical protein
MEMYETGNVGKISSEDKKDPDMYVIVFFLFIKFKIFNSKK